MDLIFMGSYITLIQTKNNYTSKKKKELKGDKIVHLQAFSSSYFVFQPIYIYFKKIGNRVELPDTSDNGLAPSLTYMVLDQEQNLMDNV